MPKVPVRLERDPILEAVFEFRFQAGMSAPAEVLQGVIFPKLRDRFPTVQRTPFSQFTALIDEPSLRYQPRLVLQGDNIRVHIGDRAVGLVTVRPYIGWKAFRPLILELLDLVSASKVVKAPERISLRYTNVLEGGTFGQQFSRVHYQASLGRAKYNLGEQLTYTRTEIVKDGFTSIVELGAGMAMESEKGAAKGLYLAVDTILAKPSNFLADPAPHVERTHDMEKEVFFDVLTDETIEAMGPTWA